MKGDIESLKCSLECLRKAKGFLNDYNNRNKKTLLRVSEFELSQIICDFEKELESVRLKKASLV